MKLRNYQEKAHDAVIAWIKKRTTPCLIEAATGSGKSHIIAALAETVHRLSGKRILCIVPSAELVKQNHSKFLLTGSPASIYSASAGEKCLRHQVIFATPRSIISVIEKSEIAKQFAMIIIDEAHGMTPTVKKVILNIKHMSPNCRVVGLTATPYRMGSGYIYKNNFPQNRVETETINPYFDALVSQVCAHELIDKGYLTPPKIGEINATQYDTSDLKINKMGKFKQDDIDAAFVGQGRKTAAIVADVIGRSQNRNGVMFFAATIQHAKEIMESLPDFLADIVTGQTPRVLRAEILKRFLRCEIKYLVNVSVLTTGFDAPHVDVIAILRATESVSLLQQIIGRGLRLCDNKHDCLVLDYAENIERHCPDGDVFNPQIKSSKSSTEKSKMKVFCEDCDTVNEFTARENPEGFLVDIFGYFMDLEGYRVEVENMPIQTFMPAHFGRRCEAFYGEIPNATQCGYRWSFKECPQCGCENDIAARYCSECKCELVDPNDKLISDFKAMKKDPHQVQCDNIVSISETESISKSGREIIILLITTEYRTFRVYLQPESTYKRAIIEFDLWKENKPRPKTITYKKQQDKQFFNIINFNEKADEIKNEAT